MRLILTMARVFNTPINVWLDMELPRLFEWVIIADEMRQEEMQRNNMQMVGPGL
jgi:hypothetical protein